MNVLVLRCDSARVRFKLLETDLELIEKDADRRLASGEIDRIGGQALITLRAAGQSKLRRAEPLRDHRAAIDYILRWIISRESKIDHITSLRDIHAVGHRIVHGGEHFQRPVRITDGVIEKIEDCIELAPFHNPANLRGIRAATELLGEGVPQVAVFNTGFHRTMPQTSYLYATPYQLYVRHKIRRYGFHGTSHRYLAYRYGKIHNIERDQVNIITLCLGTGSSACAIKDGKSFATSMGFTPLEGLVMGTRSGDIDPSLVEYLSMKEGMTVSEIDTLLNKQSGLLGVSGLTSEMSELLEEIAESQDRRAILAVDIFCQRVKHYIGGYLTEMGHADAVVFAGGIGENCAFIREKICTGLECLGLEIDCDRNNRLSGGQEGEISKDGSRLKAWVIPANEEFLIARDTFRLLTGEEQPSNSTQQS